jgi:hypothetical protein
MIEVIFDDRADNCTELVRWHLIKYMWTFEKRVQDSIATLKDKYPHVIFIEVTNNNQLQHIEKICHPQ